MLPFKERNKRRGVSASFVTSGTMHVCGHGLCHKVAQPLHHPRLGENMPCVQTEQPGQVRRKCVTHQERKNAKEMFMKEDKVTSAVCTLDLELEICL